MIKFTKTADIDNKFDKSDITFTMKNNITISEIYKEFDRFLYSCGYDLTSRNVKTDTLTKEEIDAINSEMDYADNVTNALRQQDILVKALRENAPQKLDNDDGTTKYVIGG